MIKTTQLYEVEVIETLSTIVKVLAENKEQAVAKVKDEYRQQKIILSSDDYLQTQFLLYTDNDNANR